MTYTGYKHQRALILRPESNEGILEKDFYYCRNPEVPIKDFFKLLGETQYPLTSTSVLISSLVKMKINFINFLIVKALNKITNTSKKFFFSNSFY